MSSSILLIIDAVINFILGFLLLLTVPFPDQMTDLLGVPAIDNAFYSSIFGAVLVGIGIALLMESKRTKPRQLVGLGLGGAVVINLCGGAALISWLLFGDLNLSLGGLIFLWTLSLILIIISELEIVFYIRKTRSL